MPPSQRSSLRELAGLFLKLGTISFGGPAAHIAMMEDEVVRRRQWLTREQFLDMLGATNLIPGPNSTEMAIHVGYLRGGIPGLLVAGSCFILPAFVIVFGIAWAYVRYGQLPAAGAVLHGVKPVVIAIIAQALIRLARTAVKDRLLAAVGVISVVASFLGIHELVILFGASAVVAAIRAPNRRSASTMLPLPLAAATTGVAASVGLLPLFLIFLKIGSILFGSGYVLLAFLRADFVQRLHWLTEAQLLDATAVGQVTPGPVFTTATFIGYILAGPKGAVVATVGIFLPAFVFVALSAPFIPKLRNSPTAAAVLDGLNVASLALMTVVMCQLASATFMSWQLGFRPSLDLPSVALAAVSAFLLLRYRLNATWLVAGGAVAGLCFSAAGV